MAESISVKFVDDIPKIEREGFTRSSKYDDLLNACEQNAGKAARITVDSQGKASSRASSIKSAADKRDEPWKFDVATRSGDEDNEYHVFVKYDPNAEQPTDEDENSTDEAPAAKKATKRRRKAKASS